MVARLLLFLAAIPALAAPQRPNLDTVEALVVEDTNHFRASEGLSRLTPDPQLEDVARSFARHLAGGGEFSHESGGTTPEIRVRRQGYEFCVVAENLARHYSTAGFGTRDLAQKLVQGWKDSPGHRKNMLEKDALDTGVAVVHVTHNGYEDFYAVQILARRESAAVKFKVMNRSGVAIEYRVNGKRFTLNPNWARVHSRCSAPDVLFEGNSRGHFEPARDECLLVPAGGAVTRERGGCE